MRTLRGNSYWQRWRFFRCSIPLFDRFSSIIRASIVRASIVRASIVRSSRRPVIVLLCRCPLIDYGGSSIRLSKLSFHSCLLHSASTGVIGRNSPIQRVPEFLLQPVKLKLGWSCWRILVIGVCPCSIELSGRWAVRDQVCLRLGDGKFVLLLQDLWILVIPERRKMTNSLLRSMSCYVLSTLLFPLEFDCRMIQTTNSTDTSTPIRLLSSFGHLHNRPEYIYR